MADSNNDNNEGDNDSSSSSDLNRDELALLRATLMGDMASTRRLASLETVNLNCVHPSSSKMTPLCFATHGSHVEIARFLLDYDPNNNGDNDQQQHTPRERCNVNQPCSLGSPILLASVMGATAMVRLLAERGACLTSAGKNGITPIAAACNRGHLDICQLLVQHAGPDILQTVPTTPADNNNDNNDNTTTDESQSSSNNENIDNESLSAFVCAFMADQFDVLRWMVEEQGLSINARLKQCRQATPLYFAATQRNLPMCRFLLQELGAHVDLQTLDGETALFTACRGGGSDIVAHLLDHGADPNTRNKDGTTPLLAAIHSLDDATVETLVKGGADPNAKAHGGISCLHMAASKGLLNIMKTLIHHGARISDKDSAILLHLACRSGHVDIVDYLLTKRPILRQVCNHDKWKAPLLAAQEHNHINLVRYLVEQMASGCSEQMNTVFADGPPITTALAKHSSATTATTTTTTSEKRKRPKAETMEHGGSQDETKEQQEGGCPHDSPEPKRVKLVNNS